MDSVLKQNCYINVKHIKTKVSSRLARGAKEQELNPRTKLLTEKCMEISPATADSRYYGIADTSRGPEVTFLLFYSRYNGHLGRIK